VRLAPPAAERRVSDWLALGGPKANQAPIELDAIKNGYHYTVPTYRLRFLQLTEGELVSLLVAEKVLTQYRGTPYGPALARAFNKITLALNDPITADSARLSGAISFRTSAPPIFDVSILQTLLAAAVQRRSVVIYVDVVGRLPCHAAASTRPLCRLIEI
jgi:predicted DNA-binding transcriptional regulator YafY